MSRDERFVYGAGCTWSGSIHETAHGPVPLCPQCGGVLLEMDSEQTWWDQAEQYERDNPAPGYVAMMHWARGKCFRNMGALEAAYEAYRHYAVNL